MDGDAGSLQVAVQSKDLCPGQCLCRGRRQCGVGMQAKDQRPGWCHAAEAGSLEWVCRLKTNAQTGAMLWRQAVECVWRLKTNAQTGAMLRSQAIGG